MSSNTYRNDCIASQRTKGCNYLKAGTSLFRFEGWFMYQQLKNGRLVEYATSCVDLITVSGKYMDYLEKAIIRPLAEVLVLIWVKPFQGVQ